MEITTLQPFLNLYKLSKDLSLTLYLKFQILYIFTLRSMNMSTSQNLLMHIFKHLLEFSWQARGELARLEKLLYFIQIQLWQ